MANKITTLIDFEVAKGKVKLADLKKEVDAANGFVGKFKAGFTALSDTVVTKLSSPLGIAAIGGLIEKSGEFAVNAVSKFSALGVEVGKFSDATGLTNQEASRFIEVAGDIGIGADALELAIGKMNKTAGTTPQVFKDAGIAIAYAKNGSVDAQQTFLNTIDALKAMKSPELQAAAAAKVLGRGWQSMAELIGQGSAQLKTSLADVADAKVFSPDQVQKARDFRKATDDLKDVMEEFVIQTGSELAPALSDTAKFSADVLGVWAKMVDFGKGVVTRLKEIALNSTDAIGETNLLAQGAAKLNEKLDELSDSETDRETRKLRASVIEATQAFSDFEHQVKDSTNTAAGYSYAAKDAADTTKRLADETEEASRKADAHAKSLTDQRHKTEDLYKSQRSLVDATFASRDADKAAKTALDDLNKALATRQQKAESVVAAQEALASAQEAANATDSSLEDARAVARSALIAASGELAVADQELADARKDDVADQTKITAAFNKHVAAQNAVADAAYKLNDAEDALADGEKAHKDALDAVTDAQNNWKDAVNEAKDAVDAVTPAQEAANQAILDASEKYATMNGAALDSEAGIRRQISALEAQRDALAPNSPLRKNIDEYIAALAAIPSTVSTQLDLHVAPFTANPTAPGYGSRYGGAFAEGGVVPGAPGEPMLIKAHGGETVVPAGENGHSGGDTFNVYVQTMPTPSQLKQGLKKYDRRN